MVLAGTSPSCVGSSTASSRSPGGCVGDVATHPTTPSEVSVALRETVRAAPSRAAAFNVEQMKHSADGCFHRHHPQPYSTHWHSCRSPRVRTPSLAGGAPASAPRSAPPRPNAPASPDWSLARGMGGASTRPFGAPNGTPPATPAETLSAGARGPSHRGTPQDKRGMDWGRPNQESKKPSRRSLRRPGGAERA